LKTTTSTIDDLLSKFTAKAREATSEDIQRSKLKALLTSSTAAKWVDSFSCIPEQFADFIGTKHLDSYITFECLIEMWKHSINQEARESPDVTPVADLFQVAEMEQRKPWPALPYNSLSALHEGAYWPDYDESN